jgi:hypothetical protein
LNASKARIQGTNGQSSITRFLSKPTNEGLASIKITIRALWHALVLATGINPNLMSKVFDRRGTIMDAWKFLTDCQENIGTRYIIQTDIIQAVKMMDKDIETKLSGKFMSLVFDSGTMKHDSAIMILVSCAELDTVILLHVICPDDKLSDPDDEESTVYNWEKASTDIKMLLSDWKIDLSSQVVSAMGDNVSHNANIASGLNCHLGKCQAHAYALIIKNSFDLIPLLKTLAV